MAKKKQEDTDMPKAEIKEQMQEVEDSVFQPIEDLDGIGSVRAKTPSRSRYFYSNGLSRL